MQVQDDYYLNDHFRYFSTKNTQKKGILLPTEISMTFPNLHNFVKICLNFKAFKIGKKNKVPLVKAAVRKFCLFVAISVWKPGIASFCRSIFRAWGCESARLQHGWI